MRPRGEVRAALEQTLERLYPVRDAMSARELAVEAHVSVEHANKTLERMVECGDVAIVGRHREPGTRWHHLYAPAAAVVGDTPQPWGGIEALEAAMRWFVPASTD